MAKYTKVQVVDICANVCYNDIVPKVNRLSKKEGKNMTIKEWAIANGLEDLYNQYLAECEAIEEKLEEEGKPGNGSDYELRVARLQESYPELFGEDEETEE